jgi:hypothetical protein
VCTTDEGLDESAGVAFAADGGADAATGDDEDGEDVVILGDDGEDADPVDEAGGGDVAGA